MLPNDIDSCAIHTPSRTLELQGHQSDTVSHLQWTLDLLMEDQNRPAHVLVNLWCVMLRLGGLLTEVS